MAIWDGSCMVHEIFSLEKIIALKAENPGCEIIAHPECEEELLEHASFIGSTAALLRYSKQSECDTFIVATESGILHQMQKDASNKTFIPAPPLNTCACNDCPHMRLNTLEKLYICLKYEAPEMNLDESLIEDAKRPIIKMLELSEKLGL
jgi:quinolinate synthase